jgi:hypothetical protein
MGRINCHREYRELVAHKPRQGGSSFLFFPLVPFFHPSPWFLTFSHHLALSSLLLRIRKPGPNVPPFLSFFFSP